MLAVHLFAKYRLAAPVLTVEVEAMLAEIDANERYVVHDNLRVPIGFAGVWYPLRRGGPSH